jgi:hypothetical protein
MEIIILSDGLFHLVEVTKEITKGITLMSDVDCFELCEILRLKLTDYMDSPINRHVMKDGSGDFFGCICR